MTTPEKQHECTKSPFRILRQLQNTTSLCFFALKETEVHRLYWSGVLLFYSHSKFALVIVPKNISLGWNLGSGCALDSFIHLCASSANLHKSVLCSGLEQPARHAEEELPRENLGTGILQKQHTCSTHWRSGIRQCSDKSPASSPESRKYKL